MGVGTLFSPAAVRSCRKAMLIAAVFIGLLIAPQLCMAQSAQTGNLTPPRERERALKPASESKTASDPTLTNSERAELLQIIRNLQERVTRLEAQVSGTGPAKAPGDKLRALIGVSGVPTENAVASEEATAHSPTNVEPKTPLPAASQGKDSQNNQEIGIYHEWGTYSPNRGFKVVKTEQGEMDISIYTYARYLNQRALDSTYEDAFGNIKSVQERQDFQLQKVQIKFLGWIMDPKLRYFLYAWTSNANQGRGAQVVVAGNLGYTFNKYFTLAAGITSLPGTRSVEGNFPFWLGVDSRLIADEFFRPSYTTGIFARGELTSKLKYQVMLGNNMSILGVSAAQLDNGLNTFSSALIWTPSTGEFGPGFGDYEDHQEVATRLAFHFNRSDESKESQPNAESPENTQLRLSDGSIIFTPNLFGEGITIEEARWRMTAVDGGIKYRGFALEGEYYWRWLDNFRGTNTQGIPRAFDHGFQLQGSAMVVPKTLQAYVGHSRIFGEFGDPWDLRLGANYFPFKNKVVRWNNEGLYLYKSPVGYTSVPFAVGGRGWIFHSSWELAF